MEKLNQFIEINENDIQDDFYKKHTSDPIFELLKSEEKQILIDYFYSKKNLLVNSIQNQLNALKENIGDFNDITSNIIKIENKGKFQK